jgi:hypothetical protein
MEDIMITHRAPYFTAAVIIAAAVSCSSSQALANSTGISKAVVPAPWYEYLAGDGVRGWVTVRNFTNVQTTVPVRAWIRNVATGTTVYSSSTEYTRVAANDTVAVILDAWQTSAASADNVGTMELIACITTADDAPSDDTLRIPFVVLATNALTNSRWSDNGSKLTAPAGCLTQPDLTRWVSRGATVVDGEPTTFYPVAPNSGIAPNGRPMRSPTFLLDRLDANGAYYDQCARGVGDTLISFPIDIHNVSTPVMSFVYERSGKHDYSRNYDAQVLVGQETQVTAPDGRTIYRAGDSLVLEFAPIAAGTTNPSSWTKVWGVAGGKDPGFQPVSIAIPSAYSSNHFRFRFRLLANDDGTPNGPRDDEDPVYIDNIQVIDAAASADVQVTQVRIDPTAWYERGPATQANLPILITYGNAGAAAPCGIACTVRDTANKSVVYSKLITMPAVGTGTWAALTAPTWNAGAAGPGTYELTAYAITSVSDITHANDTARSLFTPLFDSAMVMDGGSNDVAAEYGRAGLGLNAGGFADYGSDAPGGGAIGLQFTLTAYDTLRGVLLWFGGQATATTVHVSINPSSNNLPGTVLPSPCASFTIDLSKAPRDQFGTFPLPCPLPLDAGTYCITVSQPDAASMALGGSGNRASCDPIVHDPSPNANDVFVMNDAAMDHVAARQFSNGTWGHFFFPVGIGRPQFYPTSGYRVLPGSDNTCSGAHAVFQSQGSYNPLIRPYFSSAKNILPVELSSFTGRYTGGHVELSWITASERNNAGFVVERRAAGDMAWNPITTLIPGHGTSSEQHAYSCDDDYVRAGSIYHYRLQQLDNDGSRHAMAEIGVIIPAHDIALLPNSPEPFDNATDIAYTIPASVPVHVNVYDVMGRSVRTFTAPASSPGEHHIIWDARTAAGDAVPTGAYSIVLTAGERTSTRVVHVVR